jgi:ketosteroid isomerase-like protein
VPDHPHARLIRHLIELLDRQDIDAVAPYLADDVTWHYIGAAAPVRGKQTLLGALRAERGADWTIRAEIHDVTASDDHVVALLRTHATRGDQTLDADTAEIFHVEDDKVTAHWAFAADTARIDAFYA